MVLATLQNNVVEAHCYALQCRQIDLEQLRSSINQQDILTMKAFISCVQNCVQNCFVRS